MESGGARTGTLGAGFFARLRSRCGEFWWWSALIFLSCRAGDAINAFIGLWLVPRWVPTDELGAALPIMQAGTLFGLPIAILVIPFSRWLALYASRGEKGKIKRLLKIVLGGVAATFVLAVLTARFVLPHLFERLRVAEGSLGLLIVFAGLVGPFASTFSNALQGLKRFGTLALVNFLSAPVRLVTMLAAMPFRALSGYMVGQVSSPAMTVAVAAFTLRKELGAGVKSEALGRADVMAMLRYALPIAVHTSACCLLATWQSLLFRQRLPEVESAAFYIISRLAEVTAYAGLSIAVVAFPFAAEAGQKGGAESLRIAKRMIFGALVPGALLSILFIFIARPVMRAVPVWSDYEAYAWMLPLYAAKITLCAATSAFVSCETAAANFRFLWYWLPLMFAETLGLVALTGYGAFSGILPDAAVEWMKATGAARLEFFVWWLLAFAVAQILAVAIHIRMKNPSGTVAEERP